MKNLLLGVLLVLGVVGCNKHEPIKSSGKKYASTVILGTFHWDVETNTLVSNAKSDFWWQRVDATTGNLIAKNGTTVEVVSHNFDAINRSYISKFPALRDGRISHHDIAPGTIALFKTAEGNYGKLRIVGFRALHDFDFKEAREHSNPSWEKFALKKADMPEYHLVVEYQLYK